MICWSGYKTIMLMNPSIKDINKLFYLKAPLEQKSVLWSFTWNLTPQYILSHPSHPVALITLRQQDVLTVSWLLRCSLGALFRVRKHQ